MSEDRRDDWKHGVDENLAMLNTALRVNDKQIEDVEFEVSVHDRILRGDPEEGKIGLAAQYDALETLVNELRAEHRALTLIVTGDHVDDNGLEQRVAKLEHGHDAKEKREGYFWHFVTATVSGALLVITLLMLNWERVEDFAKTIWEHVHPVPPAVVSVKPKHRARHRHKQSPIVMPEISNEGTGEDM